MTDTVAPSSRPRIVVEWAYYLTATLFFIYLFVYYWTAEGGPVLLALFIASGVAFVVLLAVARFPFRSSGAAEKLLGDVLRLRRPPPR